MTITSFTSDKQYTTTLESCSCPDYVYRRKKAGLKCKHQMVLEQELNETIEQAERFLALQKKYDVRAIAERKAQEETRQAYVRMFYTGI